MKSSLFWLIRALIAVYIVAICQPVLAQTCKDVFINDHNALIDAKEYTRLTVTSFKEAEDIFGREFSEFAENTQIKRILDAGGGFSIYGIALAQKGKTVDSVNVQDFYGELFYPLVEKLRLGKMDREDIRAELGIITGLMNMDPPQLSRIASQFNVDLPYFQRLQDAFGKNTRQSNRDMANFFRELSDSLSKVKDRLSALKNFNRIQDWVENVLQRTESNTYDGGVDMAGAFYYSSNRLHILQEYARVLKPGQKFFLGRIGGVEDTVIYMQMGRQVKMPLTEFLHHKFPEHFRISGNSLILTKNPNFPNLEAELRFIEGKMIGGEGHRRMRNFYEFVSL